jgi:hypothetical protein
MRIGGSQTGDQEGAPTRGVGSDLDAAMREVHSLRGGDGANGLERDRRARELRHLAGRLLVGRSPVAPHYPEPDYSALPEGATLVEVGSRELTPGLARAAILRHGCLLVRGLVARLRARELAAGIDAAFEARAALAAGLPTAPGLYEEFEPEPPYGIRLGERPWVEMGGGLYAADSPRLLFGMFEALSEVGFPAFVSGYLGEPAVISAQKTTLRKASPDVRGAWHQDGKFLGEVKALNLWLSLSRCGDEAPGLDIVPRRLESLVAAGTDSQMPIEISTDVVEQAADGAPIMRPIFEPGDALLFDELFLHQTASDPSMPNPRFAIESWFFGPSAFPADYAPLAA